MLLRYMADRTAPSLRAQKFPRRCPSAPACPGIKKAKDSDSIPKLLADFIHRAEEGELGRLLVAMVILHLARTQPDAGKALQEASQYYKVDTDAIVLKVKQEFSAKQKAHVATKSCEK